MAEVELKLSVEKLVHDSLRKAVQEIADEYGIQINVVTVIWNDVSTASKRSAIVDRLSIHTTT